MGDLSIPKSSLFGHADGSVFITHNDAPISASGTSLMGYLNVGYDDLVEMFGEPEILDDEKVQVEWTIRFSDGVVATIYDWKSCEPYWNYRNWHIGGFDVSAVKNLDSIFKTARYR